MMSLRNLPQSSGLSNVEFTKKASECAQKVNARLGRLKKDIEEQLVTVGSLAEKLQVPKEAFLKAVKDGDSDYIASTYEYLGLNSNSRQPVAYSAPAGAMMDESYSSLESAPGAARSMHPRDMQAQKQTNGIMLQRLTNEVVNAQQTAETLEFLERNFQAEGDGTSYKLSVAEARFLGF
jgi:hypothetical protein